MRSSLPELTALRATGCVRELELPDGVDRQGLNIWGLRLEDSAFDLAACEALLAPGELERANRFLVTSARRQFSGTRAVLRLLLSDRIDISPHELRFCYDDKGKPALAGAPETGPHFNVSHSGTLALIALSETTPVGVDVEAFDRRAEVVGIAEGFFAPGEISLLRRASGDEFRRAFFQIWTRKEALLKATGQGIATGLRKLDLSLSWDGAVEKPQTVHADGQEWLVGSLLPAAGFVGALAVPA